MSTQPQDAAIWGIVPAAGMSRRMGFPKQTAMMGGATMVGTVVGSMLDAGVAGVVVVTRSELLSSLGLPRDKRIATAINDDADSEMIDSVRIGLTTLGKPPRCTSIDEEEVTVGSRVQAHIRHTEGSGGLHRPAAPGDGIMVVPADMPGITPNTYKTCIAAFRNGPNRIVIATHNGKRGHPMVFPYSMRTELGGLSGGLRELPERYGEQVDYVDTADPGTLKDLDTPIDFDAF